jgi:HD superfamily phosphohydrolase
MGRNLYTLPLIPEEELPLLGREFEDSFEFQDDIHGQIRLNAMERDVVDTPEFQRLFRLGQLGFVDLVYPAANHTRGVHSIGACHLSKMLISTLNQNNPKFFQLRQNHCGDVTTLPSISRAERILISLGALLHDISHAPFSHDIEKKTHHLYYHGPDKEPTKVKSHYGPYEKHDNYNTNPALYVFLMDEKLSVLARVLRSYSPLFLNLLIQDSTNHSHLEPFISLVRKGWKSADKEILPALLFHLLVFEKTDEAKECELSLCTGFDSAERVNWGLGPETLRRNLHEAWYQPFRHDIIGDTLSADLVDYLLRDLQRLGTGRELDLKLLNFYVLAAQPQPQEPRTSADKKTVFRTAIDLNDYKRGTVRAERINDVFRLLDLRHEIHEKAVYHRVVQSAIAMMSRALLMLGTSKPRVSTLYGLDLPTVALCGDEKFLEILVRAEAQGKAELQTGTRNSPRQTISCKLVERRVYRPLMIIPGDRIPQLLGGLFQYNETLAPTLREFAAVVDSPYYSTFFLLISWWIECILQHAIESEDDLESYICEVVASDELLNKLTQVVPKRVIFWTTPYKQLYKDPALLVRVGTHLTTIDELPSIKDIGEPLRVRVAAGVRDAETKNESLWKFYVFLSDGLFYTGLLSKLLPEHKCNIVAEAHIHHLELAQAIVVRALRTAWEYWERQKTHASFTLGSTSPVNELKQLLRIFNAEGYKFREYYSKLPAEVSAVAVDQYLHGEDHEKCRDIRYKFDLMGTVAEVLARLSLAPEKRQLVAETVRSLGISTANLKLEELSELIMRLVDRMQVDGNFEKALASDLEVAASTAALGRSTPIRSDLVRSLWLGDLRQKA